MKASNCVVNLQGMDRDVAVSLRKEIQKHAQENLLPNILPTSEDMDRFVEQNKLPNNDGIAYQAGTKI